ncbi:MAG TPA: hypothetical protein VFB62_01195, partial [Polyangiaceae bacterium]|nr:hypothetical protein [Polyangiaceae bacterium]
RLRAGQLEYLLLQPSEENVAGTHRRISGQFIYEPDTLAFGGRFTDPRLAGSRLVYAVDGNIIINQDTGDPEGSFGFFQYGLPLYSTRQKWSWGAVAAWREEVTRRHVRTALATFDAEATPGNDAIPFVYDTEVISGRVSATRSFGVDIKHDVTFGWEVSRAAYQTPDLSDFEPAAVTEFLDTSVPKSDTRNGPFVQYHFFLNQYASLLDVETMSLQENFLLGPELYLRWSPTLKIFGSSERDTEDLGDVFRYRGELAYTHQLGTGFARAYLAGMIETEWDGSVIYDSSVHTGLRIVSPSFGVGRLIYDGTFYYRGHNWQNALVQLGGDGRLRGYTTGLFIGEDLIATNVEFRTRTFSVWTFQLAGALFYDAADAFDGFEELRPKQGAGFGVRVLFPQLGRAVMRVDWGFPLTPNAGATSVFDGLVLTFRQAFGVPEPTGTGVRLLPD